MANEDFPRAAAGLVPPPHALAALAGLAVPPPNIILDGIEVTQVVQDMTHSVPLIAGKATVVRVYLSVNPATPVVLRGELLVRSPAGTGIGHSVPSLGPLHLNPADNGNLTAKRHDVSKSLNFRLPDAVTVAGPCEVRLARLHQESPSAVLNVPAHHPVQVGFVNAPPLRVHILGIRYQAGNPPRSFEPDPLDFLLIRSWLGRAYPVARVDWSQLVVDGPQAWPFDAPVINSHIRAIRFQDVQSGTDGRTHYFGLVTDGGVGQFMRGLASGIPDPQPDPSTVASGPTGRTGQGLFPWDTDGSWGDWYTGHELAHTFGRYHADFCGATGGIDYPYPNGQLSGPSNTFVGFDVGDPSRQIAMAALPGLVWHDVMTYCDYQWLSNFTYTGILGRLQAENSLPAPFAGGGGPAPASPPSSGGAAPGGSGAWAATVAGRGAVQGTNAIHIVATVNLDKPEGRFQHVIAYTGVAAGPAPGPSATTVPGLEIRLLRQDGSLVRAVPVPFFPDTCHDPSEPRTGIVDTVVLGDPRASQIDLILGGKVLDTFRPSLPPQPVRDIRSATAAAKGMGIAAAGAVLNPVLIWTDDVGAAAAGMMGLGGAAPVRGPTYNVQVSTDNGQTWRTVGLGLTRPQVILDRNLLAGASQVKVRVTSTDGFHSESTEQTLNADQL